MSWWPAPFAMPGRRAPALGIDFARPASNTPWLGWLLLSAGAFFAAVTYLDVRDLQLEHQQLLDRQAREARQALVRRSAPAPRQQASADAVADRAALARAASQLQTPWSRLFQELESPSHQAIALLSLEALGASRTARLVGEARTLDDVLAYVVRLRDAPGVRSVTLSGQELRTLASVQVVRFTLDLEWSAAP